MGLKIYKASAGSGKTYTLVKEYLNLLLQGKDNDAYKSILVATFTNKATIELRERIVRELRERIVKGEDEGERAKKVLEQILLDYDSLRVQTIDSFFQEVVRSFAFELMQTGYNVSTDVELDQNAAIELSVDQLLVRMGGEELEWIEQLLSENVEHGESTNLREKVVDLAKKLLYNPNIKGQDLSKFDVQTVRSARLELVDIREATMEQIRVSYNPLWEWLEKNEEILRFSSYSGFLQAIYNKGLEGLLKDKYDNPDKKIYHGRLNLDKANFIVPVKSVDRDAEERLLQDEDLVRELLCNAQNGIDEHWQTIQLCDILLKNLKLLPLFRGLQETIRQYQEEHNIILIDEINPLLDKIVADASAPFIYEKVGGRIRHYMIDEFQDTSGIQWANFRKLLLEAIAQQDSDGQSLESFLVGDVKQSIYRWRGTDSSLLNSKVEEDSGFSHQILSESLEDNWRSDHHIVEFNNQFFYDCYRFNTHSSGDKPNNQCYEKIYKPDKEKEVKQGKKYEGGEGRGYVRFEYIPEEKGEEIEQLKSRLKETIISLQKEEGYQAGDIAFLVRKNAEAMQIAEMLSDFACSAEESERHYFSFLSDEALLINNAKVVRLLTALFQLLSDPANKNYQVLYEVTCINLKIEHGEHLQHVASSGRSLIEVAHKVLWEVKVPDDEKLYVNAFLDLLLEYTQNHIVTYQQFVDWWQRVGINQQIAMGEGASNRIQIITIHKAKGLEFPIVIMPYVDWDFYRSGTTIEVLDRSELPSGFLEHPLDFYLIDGAPDKKQLNSLLGDKYNKILEDIYLDQLNLLYVAFTRPVNRLYLFTHKSADKKNNVATILHDRIMAVEGVKNNGNVWEYGEMSPRRESSKERREPILLQPNYALDTIGLPDLKVSKPISAHAQYGITMHDAMARALTPEQFQSAIQRLNRHDESEILSRFEQALHEPLVRSWFASSESREILVEQSIGTTKGSYRPDRIILEGNRATVVDFKFAHPALEHQAQVMGYMRLLREMGYSVSGYLWYWHEAQQIQEVTLDE